MTRYATCIFCQKPMTEVRDGSNKGFYDLFKCFDCLKPKHKSMYRQLYDIGELDILSDAIELDDFYIIRYFSAGSLKQRYNYSVINHDIIGYFHDEPDLEPMTYRLEVCELDHILDVPSHDPELMLKKLRVYTTFS